MLRDRLACARLRLKGSPARHGKVRKCQGFSVVVDTVVLVAAVRAHAQSRYSQAGKGWDYVVEAWEDSDIIEAMEGAKTATRAIQAVARALKPLAEMRAEVRAAGGEC